MIKTLTIALIMFGLIIFFLIIALIGQLSDLSKYEERINKAKRYLALLCYDNESDEYIERVKLIKILEGEDNDRKL